MLLKNQTIVQDAPTNFEWPLYKNDAERIKFNSQKYADCGFAEAFAEEYGVQLKDFGQFSELAINSLPVQLKVGDVVPVSILSVSKDNVVISCGNVKENIVVKNNLFKYKKFQQKFQSIDEIKAKVVKVDTKQTIVDLIEPMYDEWVSALTLKPHLQRNTQWDKSVKVYNLRLTRGGYYGQVEVPCINEFIGETYTVDAFIPGSQIVLNIEPDFEKWNGKTVRAFVTNFTAHPLKPGKIIAICSVKKYKEFLGQVNMIQLFKEYTEDTEWWKEYMKSTQHGIVTGIINSSKNCGVFVEIPELNITGMIPMKPQDIVKYAPQQHIEVKVAGFEIPSYYNDEVGQIQHILPYEYDSKNPEVLIKCNLKAVLQL